MKYISIDIETTGLNPEFDQILSIGAVHANLKTREKYSQFYVMLKHERIQGDLVALNMNAKLLEAIMYGNEAKQPIEFVNIFCAWLNETIKPQKDEDYKLTFAGKNIGTFDIPFIRRLPNVITRDNKTKIGPYSIKHRYLDPAILFLDLDVDEVLPNMDDCCRRASIYPDEKHNALQDAITVCTLLEQGLLNRGYYED